MAATADHVVVREVEEVGGSELQNLQSYY